MHTYAHTAAPLPVIRNTPYSIFLGKFTHPKLSPKKEVGILVFCCCFFPHVVEKVSVWDTGQGYPLNTGKTGGLEGAPLTGDRPVALAGPA